MSSNDLQIGPNVASRAAKSADPARTTRDRRPGGELCASRQIRQARQLLCELLLHDDFNFGNSLLLGAVSEDLDRIVVKLDQAAGMQKLFELWIDTKEPNECAPEP